MSANELLKTNPGLHTLRDLQNPGFKTGYTKSRKMTGSFLPTTKATSKKEWIPQLSPDNVHLTTGKTPLVVFLSSSGIQCPVLFSIPVASPKSTHKSSAYNSCRRVRKIIKSTWSSRPKANRMVQLTDCVDWITNELNGPWSRTLSGGGIEMTLPFLQLLEENVNYGRFK